MSFERPSPDFFGDLDLTQLGLDEAYLRLYGDLDFPVFAYRRNTNCDGCPYQRVGKISSLGNSSSLSTRYPWVYRFRRSGSEQIVSHVDTDGSEICTEEISLGEFGVYDLRASGKGGQCTFTTAVEPVESNLAILYYSLFLLAFGLAYHLVAYALAKGWLDHGIRMWNKFKKALGFEVKETKNDDGKEESTPNKKRLKSLDTFRGITIALMIFVNDGGGGYHFFEHATWNGLYLADLAFPWFMWIMGFCIPMSVRSQEKRKTPLAVVFWRILKRSVKLFLLGFFWGNASWINLARVRIPGVLQRFSVTYLVVAGTGSLVARSSGKRQPQLEDKEQEQESSSSVRVKVVDVTTDWARWVVALTCVIVHTCIVYLLPVPGCPTGYVGPGGLHADGAYSGDCIGGATGYIDRLVFTDQHIYGNPTAKAVYGSSAFDPEGLLGCLTSIFQVFLGYQAGQIVLSFRGHGERLTRFLVWGVACLLLGMCLCGFSFNDGPMPLNKNIWSLSYVLVTTGLAYLLLTLVYVLVDAKQWWKGEPFLYAGMNSIVLYLASGSAWQMLPFNYFVAPMNTHWERLFESLWGVSLWMLVAFVLHKNKVFVVV